MPLLLKMLILPILSMIWLIAWTVTLVSETKSSRKKS